MQQFRKLKISVPIVLSLILLLAGCGSSNNNNSGKSASPSVSAPASAPASVSASASPSAPPSSAAADAKRSFTDATGKAIEVPANPEHIAAIQYVGDLLALGVRPTMTTNYNLDTFKDELAGVSSIGDRPVNTEKLLAGTPDLILTDDLEDAAAYEQLTQIAPTVSLTFWLNEPFAHLHSVAQLLGKEAEEQAWIKEYEAAVAATKEQIASKRQPDSTALLLIASGKDLGLSGVRNGGYTLFTQLGFKAPPKLQQLIDKDPNFGFESVSMEAISDYAADYIFIELDDETDVTKQTVQELTASGVWKNLPAVKNGHVYEVSNKWGLGDATSMKAQLDEVVKAMAG